MAKRPCPICGKEAAEKTRPFCSARCKAIDLNRWLSGRYVIPGAVDDDDEAERPPLQPGRDDEE
jgi:endogenous inhibitor of DNA gyrase (YacG/DUF329 family)